MSHKQWNKRATFDRRKGNFYTIKGHVLPGERGSLASRKGRFVVGMTNEKQVEPLLRFDLPILFCHCRPVCRRWHTG